MYKIDRRGGDGGSKIRSLGNYRAPRLGQARGPGRGAAATMTNDIHMIYNIDGRGGSKIVLSRKLPNYVYLPSSP